MPPQSSSPENSSSTPKDGIRLIALDWGTTNSRAFLIDDTGTAADTRHERTGIMNVAEGNFGAAFVDLMGAWLTDFPDLPIIMCGMIGSRQGWVEAPYVRCPATVDEIAQSCIRLEVAPDRTATVVPGISYASPEGNFDVIRGEETQICGAAAEASATETNGRRLVILPGTHGKWTILDGDRIERFHTTMTGEVFAVLSHHSILGRLMPQRHAPDDAAFARGLTRSRQPGGVLHHIFSARAQALSGDELGASLPSLLSGILIGHEVAGMADLISGFESATLVGSRNLCDLYARALGSRGITAHILDGNAAAASGLWTLSGLAGIR